MRFPQIYFEKADDQSGGEVKIDEMSDETVDDLGISDLKKIEIDGIGEETPTVVPPEPEIKPPEDEVKPPVDEKIVDDKPKPDELKEDEPDKKPEPKPLVDQISELETIPKEERTDIQKVELQRLHSEKKMNETLVERDQLRKENDDLKKAVPDEPEEEFEILSEEQEKELMRDDPDEYDKYMGEKKGFETRQGERVLAAQSTTWNNIVDFYKAKTGVDGDFDPKTDEGFHKYLESDDFVKLDKFITGNYQTIKGSHTLAQIQAADRSINHDSYVSQAEIRGRQQALDDTDPNKFVDQSALDGIPKESGKPTVKKASDLQDDEIDNLGKSGGKAYIDQMEIESGNR